MNQVETRLPDQSESEKAAGASAKSNGISKTWKLIAIGIVLIGAVGGGYFYWHYSQLHPSTNNAYLGANVVRIAPQVTGRVVAVPVRSFAEVKSGELLVKIDPKPFQATLNAAEARLALARQQAKAQQAQVTAAEANVDEARARLNDAQLQTERTLKLAQRGDASKADADNARASLKAAKATLTAAIANLNEAKAQLGETGSDNANVKAAQAAVATAQLDLSHTEIRAPAAGVLGQVDLRPGAVVTPGSSLFPLVETGKWWADANFKETDLKRIQPGQPASLTLDLYPDVTLKGHVVALSPASGVAFSLLPPENATGNWVKVTQRFPVRIVIDQDSNTPPLRIGASAQVTVDASQASKSGAQQ